LRALAQWRRQAHLGRRAVIGVTGANHEALVSCQLARIFPSRSLRILHCVVELKLARTVLIQLFTHQSLSHPIAIESSVRAVLHRLSYVDSTRSLLQVLIKARLIRGQADLFHLIQGVSELHLYSVIGVGILLSRLFKVEIVDVLRIEALDPLRDD